MRQMTVEQVKEHLSLYSLQQARINRYDVLTIRNKDKKENYKKKKIKAQQIRDSIENCIEEMDNQRESEVLAQKYLCGRSLDETAEILNYSKRQIERIHLKALENISAKLSVEVNNGANNITLRPK